MSAKSFRDWSKKVESDPEYWTGGAILRVSEEIFLAMERSAVSRSELARRLGTSPAYVTKILRGNANFTLETLARLAHALDGEFKFHIAPKGTTTKWTDIAVPKGFHVAQPHASSKVVLHRGRTVSRVALKKGSYDVVVPPSSEVHETSDGQTGKLPPHGRAARSSRAGSTATQRRKTK